MFDYFFTSSLTIKHSNHLTIAIQSIILFSTECPHPQPYSRISGITLNGVTSPGLPMQL